MSTTSMPPPPGLVAAPRPERLKEDGATFRRRRLVPASEARGAGIIHEFPAPDVAAGLRDSVLLGDGAERDALARISPLMASASYAPSGYRLVRVPDAVVLNHPRVEGMVLDAEGRLIQSSRGSPRELPGNPFLRMPDRGAYYVRDDPPIAGELDRAFLPYCPAGVNYAHFIGLFLPRIALARTALGDTPFLFPDLPTYREHYPTGIRSEFLFRLPELLPLSDGNFHRPLPAGAFRVRELLVIEPADPRANRWDMMFQPAVRSAFDAIAREGARRLSLAGGGGSARLPARIYISRQGAGRRRILNHDAFAAVAAEEGFTPVRMELLDFWDQVAHVLNAREVLAMHGAGCANMNFAAPGSTLIELYPTPLACPQFIHAAVARGGLHVPVPCRKATRLLDVEVEPERLRAAIRTARAA